MTIGFSVHSLKMCSSIIAHSQESSLDVVKYSNFIATDSKLKLK